MKKYILSFIAIGLAIGATAFTAPKSRVETPYWVYTSSTNTGFKDASKYEIAMLQDPSDENCDQATDRPCVLIEAEGNESTEAGLQNYLNTFANDAQVVTSAIATKSDQ